MFSRLFLKKETTMEPEENRKGHCSRQSRRDGEG